MTAQPVNSPSGPAGAVPAPRSAGQLTRALRAYAHREGLAEIRVRHWVAYMALAGALERATGRHTPAAAPETCVFTVRGGVALELRRRGRARATRDIDLTYSGPPVDLVAVLEEALRAPYERFGFRRTGKALAMPRVNTTRVEVAVTFDGAPWTTVIVDVTPQEAHALEVELVPAFDLRALFGIAGPERVPCLSARYHLAHKLHGMTRPPTDGAPNERVQDAVDALLFRELVADFPALRVACVDVFAARGTHAWPPDFAPPGDWAGRFAELAADLELPERDLDAGATALRAFIAVIDGATGAG